MQLLPQNMYIWRKKRAFMQRLLCQNMCAAKFVRFCAERKIDAALQTKCPAGFVTRRGKICTYLLFGVPCQKRAVLPVPALGAQALVFHIVHRINSDLRTLKDELTVDLAPVADRFAPAGTDGL